jgi:hypothetical protein
MFDAAPVRSIASFMVLRFLSTSPLYSSTLNRFNMSILEIESGQQGTKTHLKPKTRLLYPEKYAERFMESLQVSYRYNVPSEGFIQCIMVHPWKVGPLG